MSDFLTSLGWGGAVQTALAGDASTRSYTRLSKDGRRAILMRDPGDMSQFMVIAGWLTTEGFSAPRVFGVDHDAGLMLIEDLGDDLIAKLAHAPEMENSLYIAATDLILDLQSQTPPAGLTIADPRYLAGLTDLVFEWYAGTDVPEATTALLQELLAKFAGPADVFVHRDFHAENLLWLPDRTGSAKVGILDFQDALIGPRSYDLVSLLDDARRDVSAAVRVNAVAHFADKTGASVEQIETELAVIGAQRNLRILGIFARLAAVRGKPGYIDLIPRVWGLLQNNLAHPVMAPFAQALELPDPTDAHLEKLRSKCPTP